jgi:integrase
MSVYSVKGKGFRYDFTVKGVRYTGACFRTKKEAKQAEAERRESLRLQLEDSSLKDMAFEELLLRRLDHVRAYNSQWYYIKHCLMARRWLERWGDLPCSGITRQMIKAYLLQRKETVSAYAANRDLRHLRACFNWGRKELDLAVNPSSNIGYFPEEKLLPYVPPEEDLDKVLKVARPQDKDYLWLIRDTLARVGEINRLRWDDVDFEKREVTLYTRKKRGGHLTPRQVPMTMMVYNILWNRYEKRDPDVPWVFWRYGCHKKDPRTGERIKGPYDYRKKLLRSLCKRAGVKPFGYHALRHYGAKYLDELGVREPEIQAVLGHDNRSTTHHYLKRIRKASRSAIEAMEQASMRSRLKVVAINSHTDSHTLGGHFQ